MPDATRPITDLPDLPATPPPTCERCGLPCRAADDLCARCLLEMGLRRDTPGRDEDTLEALFDAVDEAISGRRLRNYEILEEIGQGGMGRIFRARQRHSGRLVAIKRLLTGAGDSPAAVARFRREAEAAASLEHPHILPIYEVGEDEDTLPFFSMKLVLGGNLAQAQTKARLSPRDAVRLMAKVARAIHYAHGVGLLHRDLKPANILLSEQGEPLVADFGLAKWLDDANDLTRTLSFLGTPGYIAPEQARGSAAHLTPATDVYALGVILFELLTGRLPFQGENALAVVHQASEKTAPALRSYAPGLGRDLETVCAHCLEREPAARYPSAGELADDLERWLEGRPLLARPVPRVVHGWRWARRNPVLASAACLCVALLGALALRQRDSARMRTALDEDARAQHSVAVLPFLDLDTGTADATFGVGWSQALAAAFARCGPAAVSPVAQPPANWTGTGAQDEVRTVARLCHARTVLSGTIRHIDGRVRVSMRLTREDGTSVLGNWLTEASAGSGPAEVLESLHMVDAWYGLLITPADKAIDPAEHDPANQNPVAQTYLNTGRGLMDRRDPTDMDRAIACFEQAIQTEPQSTVARSYLCSACLGRYMLGGDRVLMDRAFAAAQEAVRLSPKNSSAVGALCSLYITRGQYADAREWGFCSLEYGDFSERALGKVAYIWKALGHPEQAIRWFEKAQVSARQRSDYDALIADCWMELCEDDKAASAYDAAMRFHPDQPDGWAGLCHLALLQRDFDRARRLFREHGEEFRTSPTARQLEAQIEFFAREYPRAGQLYEDFLRTTPGRTSSFYGAVDVRSAVGWLRARTDPAAGRQILVEAQNSLAMLTSNPQTPDALYRAAAIHASLGETEPALAKLRGAADAGWLDERSLALDPRFDSLRNDARLLEIRGAVTARAAGLRRHFLSDREQPTP